MMNSKNKMDYKLTEILPEDIENKSFEIIRDELENLVGAKKLEEMDKRTLSVIMRAIHTSADFDYWENLKISKGAVGLGIDAIASGCTIVTDTNMAKTGINKNRLSKLGGRVECFMADEDVAQSAKENGTTRAVASMEKASKIDAPVIFAIGNAPTALVKLCELLDEGRIEPVLVIGIPVGFVNVVESKEMLMKRNVPFIVGAGRKGGSNVAAAICNAMIYSIEG